MLIDIIFNQLKTVDSMSCSKDALYNKLKPLSRYIRQLSKYKKEDLIKLKNQLMAYCNNKNKYDIKLDDQQKAVVEAPIANLRVIAGAGSGKTTTILNRIKYLVDKYTTPDTILIMTFNVDACNSIKDRVHKLFGFDINIDIRTIDSFCCKIQYEYGHLMGDNSFVSRNEYGIRAERIMNKYGAAIANKYQYVFFDEFQDVNRAQFGILKAFADNGSFLTVIGDDNQNIYQWRGSDNSFIIDYDMLIKNSITYDCYFSLNGFDTI